MWTLPLIVAIAIFVVIFGGLIFLWIDQQENATIAPEQQVETPKEYWLRLKEAREEP